MNERQEFNRRIIEEFRANQGKVGGQFSAAPLLLLTMTGAKSGREITIPLAYSKDANRLVIIASFAGSPKNPDWYHNLVKHPEVTVELGSERFKARAALAPDGERDRLYQNQAKLMPVFNDYQKKTARRIPVFVLERV